jgi:hypothetical protein
VCQTIALQHPFDAVAERGDLMVWEVELPGNRQAAATHLTLRAALLDSGQQALPIAGRRLEAFVQDTH